MLIAALLTIAKTWKQLRCPLTDEWMEYYSAIKMNAFESVLMCWMNLEPIIQSEISQKEKYKYRILTHTYRILRDGTDECICRSGMETQT